MITNTMGLFKKKEKIPTIPTSPSLPPLPSIKEEPAKRDLPELPSFPSSPKNENLNQEMVKSAVSELPSPGEKEEGKEDPTIVPLEEPKKESMVPSKSSTKSTIPEPPKQILPTPEKLEAPNPKAPVVPAHLPEAPTEGPKPNEPIFVRIDKFQAAQKNFNQIKSKITQMEEVLQKIKEVKAQEEEELKGWTEDVEKLKARLSEIDSDIFSRL